MNYLAINKVAAVILLQLRFCLGLKRGPFFTGDLCLSWHSNPCVGGDRGLTSTAVELSYWLSQNSRSSYGGSLQLLKNTTYNVTHSLHNKVIDSTSYQILPADMVSFSFTQNEHGGGNCNCVDIYFNNNCLGYENR